MMPWKHFFCQRDRRLHLLRLFFLYGLGLFGRLWITTTKTPHRHIVLIKPDHLGDVLLITPALRRLRQNCPQARIVALLGPWSAQMLAHNPDIDTVLTLPFPGFDRRNTAKTTQWSALIAPYITLLRYAALLRAGAFDTALILRDDHWWGAALALLAGIPHRIGYAASECRPLLSDAHEWDPNRHVTEQALTLVESINGHTHNTHCSDSAPSPVPPLSFTPTADDQAWITDWLAEQGIAPTKKLIALHPGTGGVTKHWLQERWAAVADALAQLPDTHVVLTGGPSEEALIDTICGLMREPVATLVGQAGVGQLAALFGRAALVLGVDSGPLHIAVSQGTPSLHLFGPSAHKRFGPWGAASRHVVVRADLSCSPCGEFGACPRQTDPPECMERITSSMVIPIAHIIIRRYADEGRLPSPLMNPEQPEAQDTEIWHNPYG